MNIADYIPFYVGQPFTRILLTNSKYCDTVDGILHTPAGSKELTIFCAFPFILSKVPDFRLLLYSLKDITKEHAMWVVRQIVHPNVEYPENDYRTEITQMGSFIIDINNDWCDQRIVLGSQTGAIWSYGRGNKEIYSTNCKVPAEVYRQLCAWGYDMFGLLNNKLAVDRKTFKM